MRSITKILIANRGEIACRIIRTAASMGLRTVAVYSDADARARHVTSADEAVRIGPAPVSESYLKIDALIDAAQRSGADAIHPGYGFLSENAEFAAAVEQAGLIFIGPPAAAIAAMGNKAAAKRRMIEAGVPCVPGYQGADQADATLIREALRIGLPVMVKAAAGGGGRGMRLVTVAAELGSAIEAARSEAVAAFGSGELILEKAVVDARHVEVQVFGDNSWPCHPPRRARLLGAAAASEGDRGSAVARCRCGVARQDGDGCRAGGAQYRLSRRGHGRVPARCRWAVLFPRDEHAAAGRASGDRG